MAEPTSDHEWTIHSINIHGVFFERLCQKVVEKTGEWRVRAINYPVEFPPPNGPLRGKESALDIRAELQRSDKRLTLLIECKKHNPNFVEWVFFPKAASTTTNPLSVSIVQNKPREAPASGWVVSPGLRGLSSSLPLVNESRETRGSYAAQSKGDKTKTSNHSISEAAYQVALATRAITVEEPEHSRVLGDANPPVPMPWAQQVFIPIIATTAKLLLCEFNAGDVDTMTGEIEYSKATLTPQPYIVYEYPLPRHLQSAPADLVNALSTDSLDRFARMHIVVVNSESLEMLLKDFAEQSQEFFAK